MNQQIGQYELPAFGEFRSQLAEHEMEDYCALHWVSPELIRRNDNYQITWEMILLEYPTALGIADKDNAHRATFILVNDQPSFSGAVEFVFRETLLLCASILRRAATTKEMRDYVDRLEAETRIITTKAPARSW
jgi:hypothetical protein